MSTAASIGATVKRRRRELGLSQDELAELASVSVRFLRDVEHAKATVRLDKLDDVLRALGLETALQVRPPR